MKRFWHRLWKPLIRRSGGFTLVELMLVLVFVGVSLTALMTLFRTGIRSSVEAEEISIAVQLAEAKLEQIKSDKAAKGADYLISQNYPVEYDPDGFSGYVRQTQIVDLGEYKKVIVRVLKNEKEVARLVTIFTNY
jgi:type II secretory pathway pseudopilin PulG